MEALVHRAVLIALPLAMWLACSPATPVAPSRSVVLPGPPAGTLEADPAFGITMAGARQVATHHQERAETIEGPVPAYVSREFEVGAASSTVVAFYDAELLSRGWTHDFPPTATTLESETRGWCKPQMIFRLGIVAPGAARSYGIVVPDGVTRFEAGILGTNARCPQV